MGFNETERNEEGGKATQVVAAATIQMVTAEMSMKYFQSRTAPCTKATQVKAAVNLIMAALTGTRDVRIASSESNQNCKNEITTAGGEQQQAVRQHPSACPPEDVWDAVRDAVTAESKISAKVTNTRQKLGSLKHICAKGPGIHFNKQKKRLRNVLGELNKFPCPAPEARSCKKSAFRSLPAFEANKSAWGNMRGINCTTSFAVGKKGLTNRWNRAMIEEQSTLAKIKNLYVLSDTL